MNNNRVTAGVYYQVQNESPLIGNAKSDEVETDFEELIFGRTGFVNEQSLKQVMGYAHLGIIPLPTCDDSFE